MSLRSGWYIVPTDRWYIERTVWLVAGIVLLTGTTLALTVHPLFALLILATGIASIVVSFTGFCIIGNILIRLGFKGMLSEETTPPSKWYRMRIDSWYLERRIYIAVGINISLATIFSLVFSPWWLAFTAFVGLAMVSFAATGWCIMANALYWLGAEPRLVPQCGTGSVKSDKLPQSAAAGAV